MRLCTVAPDRIEIVAPRGTSQARICAFARRNADWIERIRTDLARTYRGDASLAPEEIHFPAVGTRWRLEIVGNAVTVVEGALGRPQVYTWPLGDARELPSVSAHAFVEPVQERLRHWLIAQGTRLLPAKVACESERLNLRPSRVQVRLQRSRWGSCSAKRTISLNARALFLEPEVLRYLIVHELCHLAHMSHSAEFWRRVARHEPDFRRLDAALGSAWATVPRWAYSPRR